MRSSILFPLLGIAIAVAGCGGSSNSGGTGGAGGSTGGAFAGGTYNLVSQIFYGSAAAEQTFLPGQPFRQTYVLSDVTPTSFTLDQAWRLGTGIARSHETAAVSGMTATFTQICPDPDGGIDWGGGSEFTATSDSITLFRPTTIGVLEVTVYNKAP